MKLLNVTHRADVPEEFAGCCLFVVSNGDNYIDDIYNSSLAKNLAFSF